MLTTIQRALTWLSAAEFQRRAEARDVARLEAYLSSAVSLSHLEELQRSWDRGHRSTNFAVAHYNH